MKYLKEMKKISYFFHTNGTVRKATHLRMITEVLNVLPSCIPSSNPWNISTNHKVLSKAISSNIPLNRTSRRLRTNTRMQENVRRIVKNFQGDLAGFIRGILFCGLTTASSTSRIDCPLKQSSYFCIFCLNIKTNYFTSFSITCHL